jgi:nicotinamide mononucleotide (NMN) deamidase PncC
MNLANSGMDPSIVSVRQLVRMIHGSGHWVGLVTSGGGGAAPGWLLEVPGASKSIVEVVVPYHPSAFTEYLGFRPEQFCSVGAVRALAVTSFSRVRKLVGLEANTVGVGCTASLVSDRPKRGPHRVHVAYQTAGTTGWLHLELTKGVRSRIAEDHLASRLILWALAEVCQLPARPALPLRPEETLERRRLEAPPQWSEVFLGKRSFAIAAGTLPGGQWNQLAIFPGSFAPFHEGHEKIVALARELAGRPVVLEISLANADKPPLDFLTLQERLQRIPHHHSVVITRSPTFVEKAEIFPGAIFLVGADTLLRIADARFYGGNPAAMLQAVARIAGQGCRFLVFGRKVGENFLTLREMSLPPELRNICQEVPESLFRMDISATAIRRGLPGQQEEASPED